MIEKLKEKDIGEATKVYDKGLKMQNPRGYDTLKGIIRHLKKVKVFVYKKNNKIKGLISFSIKPKNKIRIDSIYVIEPRKRIGKNLMKKLADFSSRNKIKIIYTSVSSKDKRALNFYESCGFKKFGKYCSYQNLILYRIRTTPQLIKEHLIKK